MAHTPLTKEQRVPTKLLTCTAVTVLMLNCAPKRQPSGEADAPAWFSPAETSEVVSDPCADYLGVTTATALHPGPSVSCTADAAGDNTEVVYYYYNSASMVTQTSTLVTGDSSNTLVPYHTMLFEYDALNRPTRSYMDRKGRGCRARQDACPFFEETEYVYDATGRLIELVKTDLETDVHRWLYYYNGLGQITVVDNIGSINGTSYLLDFYYYSGEDVTAVISTWVDDGLYEYEDYRDYELGGWAHTKEYFYEGGNLIEIKATDSGSTAITRTHLTYDATDRAIASVTTKDSSPTVHRIETSDFDAYGNLMRHECKTADYLGACRSPGETFWRGDTAYTRYSYVGWE